METKGKTLVTEGKTLVTKRKILLGDQREDLCDSAKHNQLPAGPREKRPIGRLFSSSKYSSVMLIHFPFSMVMYSAHFTCFQ